ncbi:putative Ig domain-containing protein [Moheibacter sediminis]|uniref:Por secretion system C-terminal sorting domain-containing protein n=1 Tax=Moheibacter sediminis TaxID=1434700 RepID=A0A1W2A9N3_9FLAO|nr:putative Ig domain-containing protein [Moheibacter sediminis]SMC57354.1 Por secretion system C-terminal sorting domain-containing protein [Moheibacter sediminis]
MRNIYYLKLILPLVLLLNIGAIQFLHAQGTETFETQTSLNTSYANGSFSGETTGVTVNYVHARNEGLETSDDFSIDGKGIILRRIDEQSAVEFVIPNGVGNFSFDARKAFTGGSNNRILGVYANGNLVFTTPTFGGSGTDTTIHEFSTDVNLSGEVTIKITYPTGTSNGNKQVTIDNISWTAYSDDTEISPVITEETFNGVVGTAASFQIQATENPTSYTIVSGTLPDGLNLDTAAGIISGNPTTAGNSSVNVTAANENGTSDEATISFEIAKGNQTVTPELEDITKVIGDDPFELIANTDQGITITYTSSDTNVATVNGNTVTIVGEGTTTIQANNEGNENYNAFEGSFVLTVTEENTGGGYDGNGTFVKINSIDELTDGYYIIAANPEFGDWAMSNEHTGTYLVRSAISPVEEVVTNPEVSMVWKIETNGTGKSIYNEESAKYVSYTGSSNNVQIVDDVTADNQRWNITFGSDEDESDIFIFTNMGVTNRILQYNSNTNQERFACYTTNQKKYVLYKLTEETTDAPVITEETFNGVVGTAASFQIQATENPTSYTIVSGTLPDGLNLDTATGIISGTPTTAGNSSVNVTAANENGTSNEATISFEIAKGNQTVTPELEDITKVIGDDPFELIANTDQGITITYTSSDTNVATVNGNTVTIVGEGTTTIQANNEGNENYNAFEGSFVLTVSGELITGDFNLNSIQIYTHNQDVVIVAENEKIVSVELFNLEGKVLHRKNEINNSRYQIQNLAKGVVIVVVKTQNGILKSKKLLIK